MNYYQYPDYMYHYGVKGMKWGVRKRVQSKVSSFGQNRRVQNKTNTKKMSTKKKVALGVGVAAGVGAAVAGGVAGKRYLSGKKAAAKAAEVIEHNRKMKAAEAIAKTNYTKYGKNFYEDLGDIVIRGDKYGYGVYRK